MNESWPLGHWAWPHAGTTNINKGDFLELSEKKGVDWSRHKK